jgi:hypothetical protein
VESDWIIPAYRAYDRPTLTGPLSQIIQAAIDAGIARTAIRETIEFVRTKARPWIDSNVEKASEDPLTISQIGDLEIRLHAAEALLQRAARLLDEAEEIPTETTVAKVSIAVAEAKAVTTEIAILATNKLFELAGTQSTLGKYNLDRHWRNARTHTLHDPVRWKILCDRQLLSQRRQSTSPSVELRSEAHLIRRYKDLEYWTELAQILERVAAARLWDIARRYGKQCRIGFQPVVLSTARRIENEQNSHQPPENGRGRRTDDEDEKDSEMTLNRYPALPIAGEPRGTNTSQ